VRTIAEGDRGEAVRDVQARLSSLGHRIDQSELEHDRFASSTDAAVRAFQQTRSLLVDGLVGPQTWQELVEAGYALGDRVLYLRVPPFRGDDVRALQARLNQLGFDPGREDGILGAQTAAAAREFQRNVGLNPDAVVGMTTLQALDRLRASVTGPGRADVRELELLRSPTTLEGRVVAIDAGHGPEDPGVIGPGGLVEHEVTFAIAEQLALELEVRGATPIALRQPGEGPLGPERAVRANDADADVLVSIHLNAHADAGAEGASTYYFGRLGTVSVSGRALAESVQTAITEGVGLKDGRTHPKSFPLLRETQMPAIHVEPCFLTNPREERLLAEGKLVHDLALAIADGLAAYFAAGDA